ncbi:MAG: bifunctional precorrin-2 dehydrogenase/sirohydrochlorin ferrochelatase [bacterium]|nr:bifunctional precorrin-2 dehydrogenase/sirohydrochlorin ferrochelatase [bacterium]
MLYPINLNVNKKPCVVIGGGEVALRKVESLLSCGAQVTVVAPQIHPALQKLARAKRIRIVNRAYQPEDVATAFLVIGATNSNKVNQQIAQSAKQRNVLVNIVDTPELCNFQVPASIRRGSLLITVSTEGKAPALSKHLRTELEKQFGPEYAMFVEKLAKWRTALRKLVPNQKQRDQIMSALVTSDILYLLQRGLKQEAELRFKQIIQQYGT